MLSHHPTNWVSIYRWISLKLSVLEAHKSVWLNSNLAYQYSFTWNYTKTRKKKQFWPTIKAQQETSWMTAWLKHDPPVDSSTSKVLTSNVVRCMHSHQCSWPVILSTTLSVYFLLENVGFYNSLISHVQLSYATSNLTVILTSSEAWKQKLIQDFNRYIIK